MEITKQDSKMLKGVAIFSMLMLHLFCRKTDLPYTPLIWIGDIPLIYYFGLFGDICVSMYCFISGYAHNLQSSDVEMKSRWKRLFRFLIQFWVIVVLASVLGLLTGNRMIPGSFTEFLLNCTTIKYSYNSAWWYANTYILLVALQPLSCKFVERCPAWFTVLSTFIFYIIGYGIRFWGWGACESPALSWVITHIGLLGTSYFPYCIGMLFYKKRIISRLRQVVKTHAKRYTDIYICMGALLIFAVMLIMHGLVQSLFVAVFTATVTIILFCLCPLPRRVRQLLCNLGEHSTNIWLVHMFFYLSLFKNLVFCLKYPIPILLLLLLFSLVTSYLVNWLSKPILKLVR